MSQHSPDYELTLLTRLLAQAESQPVAELHLDDETLVLFADGALSPAERQAAIEHLADCAECRQLASAVMQLQEEAPFAAEAPRVAPSRASSSSMLRSAMFALAACLLLAVTVVLFRPDSLPGGATAERRAYDETRQLLATRQFSKARDAIAQAADAGTRSDRLQSLDAQAARQMTSVVALGEAGRLTDFGIDVTGAVGRAGDNDRLSTGLENAEKSLSEIGHESVEALLNRGHVALSAHRIDPALADFEAAAKLAPLDPLPHLGLGLAHFLNDSLPPAESAFRQAIQLDPKLVAAQMNLAITLTEQGKPSEAISVWQEVRTLPLDKSEREHAERALKLLKSP